MYLSQLPSACLPGLVFREAVSQVAANPHLSVLRFEAKHEQQEVHCSVLGIEL